MLRTKLLDSRASTAGLLLFLLSAIQYETLSKFNSKDEIRTASENKSKYRIYLFWNKMNDVPVSFV